MDAPEIQDSVKKQHEAHVRHLAKCALDIRVIDDTALLHIPRIRNRNLNKNHQENNKENKKSVRRKNKKVVEKNVKKSVSCVYSRDDMEALRFVDLEGQKNKWEQAYCGLSALVAREYDGLLKSCNPR